MNPLRVTVIVGVAIVLLAAVAIATLVPRRDLARMAALRGTPLVPPKPAVDFVLTDGGGRPARIVDPAYAVTFLFFGYTHCPDECPLAMATLGHAYRELTPTVAARTRIVFVTVDPRRDTPRVVERYVASFGPRIVGLTGSAATLASVWRAYGVSVDAKTREIGHGDAIYAIDDSERVVLEYPPSVDAADLAADASTLTAPTSPSSRARS